MGLYYSYIVVKRVQVALMLVGYLFIVGIRALAMYSATLISFYTQVTRDQLLLKLVIVVVQDLTLAAKDNIRALAIVQFQLQELYNKLGYVKQVYQIVSQARDGYQARVQLMLVDSFILSNILIYTTKQLVVQMANLQGITLSNN